MAAGEHLGKQFENPRCPDSSSHWENAFDRLHPEGGNRFKLSPEEGEKVDREAEMEYRNCEGHGYDDRDFS